MTEDHPNMEERLRRVKVTEPPKPLRTVALLAREPGLLVLQELISNPLIKLDTVVTHANLPRSEGGGPRPELPMYRAMCKGHAVLMEVDFIAAKMPTWYTSFNYMDLLICLSWRNIVQPEALRCCRHAINIHRGELPKYAGAEPVRKALDAREQRVAITAHHMVQKIDAGPEIARVWHDVGDETDPEQVKRNMYPLYAPLARMAIQAIATPGTYKERDMVTGRIIGELPPNPPHWDGAICVDEAMKVYP